MEKQVRRLKRLKNISAQDSGKRLKRTASPILELANTSTKGGDVLGFSARIVNWQPWYSVYQDHDYESSSFYNGPDFARAARAYKDVLLAFKGAGAAEEFDKQVGLYMKKIENFVAPYSNGVGNENTYIREIMPKFLGYLDQ